MIKDLKANSNVLDKFLVEKVNQGTASNGATYLTVTLKDKTGLIEARLWNSQREDAIRLQAGVIVEINGLVSEYQRSLQVKINNYEIIPLQEADLNLFVKSAPVSESLMWEQINEFIGEIKNNVWKQIVEEILKKQQDRFKISPAAVRHHHNIHSGLMWHTLTMLQTAKAICEIYNDRKINKSLLYAGIILHDMGKTKELQGDLTVEYSVQGKLIGHISIMAGEIATIGEKLQLDMQQVILLQHMVLASHGKNEYGSPVLPQIMEAEILHHIDNLDARIYAIDSGLEQIENEAFSQRIGGLENRSFYRHNYFNSEN